MLGTCTPIKSGGIKFVSDLNFLIIICILHMQLIKKLRWQMQVEKSKFGFATHVFSVHVRTDLQPFQTFDLTLVFVQVVL